MGQPAAPRLPLRPLLVASGCDRAVSLQVHNGWGQDAARWERACRPTVEISSPITTLAELVGVTHNTATRWNRCGVPLDSAEDAAFAVGVHPAFVWGDEWLFTAGCPLAKVVAAL